MITPKSGYSTAAAVNLVDIAKDNDFCQLINEPTRIQGDTRNILDLTFTNNSASIYKSSVIEGVADHLNVLVDVNATPTRKRKVKRKVFLRDKADTASIFKSLKESFPAYEMETSGMSADVKWNWFQQMVHNIMDKHIPHKITSSRYNLPWFDRSLRRLCRKKQRLYNIAKASLRRSDWDMYNNCRKLVQKSLRSARSRFIKNNLETAIVDKPKVFWNYIKNLRKDENGVADLKYNDALVSDSTQKAEILNRQFASVFTVEKPGNLPDRLEIVLSTILSRLEISNDGVLKQLKDLDSSKAQGPDAIPPWFLKLAAIDIAPYLTDIFQTSVDSGIVPDIWKQANIAPVFKKGDRSEAANYRPVSLTVVASKILEHIIASHIMKHAEANAILNNNQHGFRARRSTDTQLILTVDDIAKQLNDGKLVDMAILDFTKAFDKVPHRRLIHKLRYYGMSGQIATWIQNFLTGRSQRVVVDGKFSNQASVVSGVPQGTVLGPIAFLFYINDLASNIASQVRLFADDCLLYTATEANVPSPSLQSDLHLLEKWQDVWLMSFNPSKCVTMTIGTRNPPRHTYSFCGQQLEPVNSHPYLGVCFNNTLTWKDHINKTSKKAQRVLGLVRRNLWMCNQKVKTTAYTALIRPLLEYASCVWDSSNQSNNTKLERVQRQAARFCKNNYEREEGTVTKLLADLEWEPLSTRRKQKKATMFYKITHSLVDISLADHLVYQDQKIRGNSKRFRQIRYKLDRYGDTFFPSTIPVWNRLPSSAVNAITLEAFKYQVTNTN